ncbi:unnamed protein product [Porites evermanni]|uniref:Tetratricopeptide repeat protein n=1 Tax=Porites evermanni TaxID=104178 RepID=A0ABN8Q2X8_9CNID|nr:unnamed protein product [Porites evermanni]
MNLGTVKAALHKEDVSLIALFMFPQIIHHDLTFQQALFFCVTTGERPGARVVEAEKCYSNAIKYRPRYPDAFFNLGNLVRKKGQ